MKLTCADLKGAFLSNCRRSVQTSVVSEENIDSKKVVTNRNYTGVPTDPELLMMQSGYTDTNASSIRPGEVYFTDNEILDFLNQAWEKLHNEKCEAIKGAMMDPQHSASQLEVMIYEMDQLYTAEKVIFEYQFASKWFSKEVVTRYANDSHLFILTDEMITAGPPTICSVTLMEYPSQWFGIQEPLVTKVCRLVGVHEIAGYINLASNSRYSSGALYLHRKTYLENMSADIVEVFHKRETPPSGSYGGMAVALNYIRYPTTIVQKDLNPKDSRVLEVAYGYQIAHEAALLAMLQDGPQGNRQTFSYRL